MRLNVDVLPYFGTKWVIENGTAARVPDPNDPKPLPRRSARSTSLGSRAHATKMCLSGLSLGVDERQKFILSLAAGRGGLCGISLWWE